MKKKYTNFSQFSFNSFHHPACLTLRVFCKFGKKQCVRNHLEGTRQTQRERLQIGTIVLPKNRILSSRLIPISSQFFDKVASSTTYSFVVDNIRVKVFQLPGLLQKMKAYSSSSRQISFVAGNQGIQISSIFLDLSVFHTHTKQILLQNHQTSKDLPATLQISLKSVSSLTVLKNNCR